jgi:hypothetical protein
MLVRILYHDHCFDGAASAAFFSRFIEGRFHPGAEFAYTGMAHTAHQLFSPGLFDGDENAIVDFKYSTDPRLTWWFDHHQSAFLTPEDAENFRRDTSGRKMYDPSFRSCTMYIATVAKERFGFEAPDLDELVKWADIVDGAQYADAREAVELRAPAMRLTLVIEGAKGSETVQKIIVMMRHKKLAEIAADPEIEAVAKPLYERHLRSIDIIQKQSRCDDGVVYFDLIDYDLDLHRFGELLQLPDQGFGGFEPVGDAPGESQPGDHLRALRRRRPSQGGRHQFPHRRDRGSPRRGP